MQDVLILGCGYLGSRLAACWLAEGPRVFATTRCSARAAELRASGIEPVVCDVTEPATLGSLPAVDTAVFCVGLDRMAGTSLRQVTVEGLGHVLARLPAPRRLLYVSSTSVYGQRDGEEVDETAATEPAEESGRVVLEAEGLLRKFDPAALVLRFAGIYGPGRLLRSAALQAGTPLTGDPEKWLNLIHVDDGAAAVLAAAARGRPGAVYNVSDGCPVRRGAFYARLAQLLGAAAPTFVTAAAVPEGTNRRIVNHRLRQELGVELRFPDCAEGLRAACR